MLQNTKFQAADKTSLPTCFEAEKEAILALCARRKKPTTLPMRIFSMRILFIGLFALACQDTPHKERLSDAQPSGWQRVADLPVPIANNAVAALHTSHGCMLFSAFGIDTTRSANGIHRRVFTYYPEQQNARWIEQPKVPTPGGLLGSSAVALRDHVYVLGGYQVTPQGAEITSPALWRFAEPSQTWVSMAPLLIPIDDAVAVAWRDRWIIVVSGWSNTAPISQVQIYDVESDQWSMATSFPGSPVFGHAGALVDDELIIMDGVRSDVTGFKNTNQSWRAQLDTQNPTTLTWIDMGKHPGVARYRAAAGSFGKQIIVHGGTDNPYNFDGLSYTNNQPSEPWPGSLVYDMQRATFSMLERKPTATMDHRALLSCNNTLYSIGGMTTGPTVTAQVWQYHF